MEIDSSDTFNPYDGDPIPESDEDEDGDGERMGPLPPRVVVRKSP